jgi:hypothetical protein
MNCVAPIRPIVVLNRPGREVVRGEPDNLIADELGGIAHLASDKVVPNRLQHRSSPRPPIHRILDVADLVAARLLGVPPSKRLLLELCSTGLVCLSLASPTRSGRVPEDLSNASCPRVGVELGRHLLARQILLQLLPREARNGSGYPR